MPRAFTGAWPTSRRIRWRATSICWRRACVFSSRDTGQSPIMISAREALALLREGNRRLAANQATSGSVSNQARREALVSGQEPFAIVLGCSDSRVPAELVFDQGFGDLFVIRVA